MSKFEIKQTETGWRFDLKAGNGESVAASEVYETRAACIKGVRSVIKNCTAGIEDRTVHPVAQVRNPKFEIFNDRTGAFRFRLKAKNGKIIAVSEGYATKAGCENGIASIKRNAPDALVEEG